MARRNEIVYICFCSLFPTDYGIWIWNLLTNCKKKIFKPQSPSTHYLNGIRIIPPMPPFEDVSLTQKPQSQSDQNTREVQTTRKRKFWKCRCMRSIFWILIQFGGSLCFLLLKVRVVKAAHFSLQSIFHHHIQSEFHKRSCETSVCLIKLWWMRLAVLVPPLK